MELETAARRHLLGQAAITSYVGTRVWKHRLLEHVDGTGQRAIVVRRGGGWDDPDPVRTVEYPILLVDCWADVTRGPDGEMTRDNAVDNAFAVARIVDNLLHGIPSRGVFWGAGGTNPGLMVISSRRWWEPFATTAQDVHPTGTRGVRAPDLPKGDSAVVSCAYAIETVH